MQFSCSLQGASAILRRTLSQSHQIIEHRIYEVSHFIISSMQVVMLS